jgi:hypothetical protein
MSRQHVKTVLALSALAAACLFYGCANAVNEDGDAILGPLVWTDGGTGPADNGGTVPAAHAQNGCTRDILEAAVDSYLTALAAGDHTLMPLTATARYIENDRTARNNRDRVIPFGQGLWESPVVPDHHLNLLDVDACATFTEVIIATARPQYVLGVRLLVNVTSETSVLTTPRMIKSAAAAGFEISEVNAVVTQQGDWLFDADAYLRHSRAEDWSVLPENQRITKEELLDGAEAYFRYFSDKSVDVPWGIPCARLEGGAYTGNRPNATCNVGIPDLNMNIPTIWHLTDVDHGMVVLYVFFGGPDTHLFRILPTGYRYIHTLTAMLQSDFTPSAPQLSSAL